MENYDYQPNTDSLQDFSAKHITGCGEDGMSWTCAEGFGECNKDILDGCETDITTKENCGSCGNVCGELALCSSGQCCLNTDSVDIIETTDGEYSNAQCCSGNRKCMRIVKIDSTNRTVYHCRTACEADEADLTPN
jgi:hypothetical protein